MHPRTEIVFEVYGGAGLGAEAQEELRYWLQSPDGARVELRREQLGTLIRLVPRETLAPDTDYELRGEFIGELNHYREMNSDVPLTHFRTGSDRPLPVSSRRW